MSAARVVTAVAAAAVLAACSSSPTETKKTVIASHPAGVLQAPDSVSKRPYGAAISSLGLVFVTQLDSTTLAGADAATLALSGHVQVEAAPTAVAFNPAGTTAYVANQFGGSIGVVDVAARTQVARVPITGDPFNVIVAPSGATVYATSNAPYVFIISASGRSVVDSVALNGPAVGMALNPSASRLYVSDFFIHAVREINTATHTILRTFSVGNLPQGIAVAPDSSRLYVANEGGYMSVIDLASGIVTDTIPLAGAAFDLAMTPDGAQLYVGLHSSQQVSVYDRTTLALINTLVTGGIPRRIAFTADGKTAAIANEFGWIDFVR